MEACSRSWRDPQRFVVAALLLCSLRAHRRWPPTAPALQIVVFSCSWEPQAHKHTNTHVICAPVALLPFITSLWTTSRIFNSNFLCTCCCASIAALACTHARSLIYSFQSAFTLMPSILSTGRPSPSIVCFFKPLLEMTCDVLTACTFTPLLDLLHWSAACYRYCFFVFFLNEVFFWVSAPAKHCVGWKTSVWCQTQ